MASSIIEKISSNIKITIEKQSMPSRIPKIAHIKPASAIPFDVPLFFEITKNTIARTPAIMENTP